MMRLLATTAIITTLAAAPALAQDQRQGQQPQAQQQQQQGQQAQQPGQQKGSFRFVEAQKPTEWSAEALIGRSVLNPQGESLGDINNVIIDEDGRVTAVTIGVGGFLGIGEKDVGVPFDALEFRPRAKGQAGTGVTDMQRTPPQGQAGPPAGQQARQGQQPPAQPMQQAQQPRQGQQPMQQDQTARSYDTEHENVEIYLNATKELLENAPEYAWLGDQNRARPAGQGGTMQQRQQQQR